MNIINQASSTRLGTRARIEAILRAVRRHVTSGMGIARKIPTRTIIKLQSDCGKAKLITGLKRSQIGSLKWEYKIKIKQVQVPVITRNAFRIQNAGNRLSKCDLRNCLQRIQVRIVIGSYIVNRLPSSQGIIGDIASSESNWGSIRLLRHPIASIN
jgi:hypothetical protein